MNKTHLSRSGFTVLEIVVVVTIIGLLAAMAVVVPWKSRKNAVSVAMLNDARQIAQAIQKIETDNAGIPADTPLVLSVTPEGVLANASVTYPSGAIPADQIRDYLKRVSGGYSSNINCVLSASASGGTVFTMSHPLISPAQISGNSVVNSGTTLGALIAFDDAGKPR
jgi:prepilin-type N-terminal cleavage/methylation domain-containing protein